MERPRRFNTGHVQTSDESFADVDVDAAWESGGSCFSTVLSQGPAVTTSLKVSDKYIAVSLDNAKVFVFNKEGELRHELDGHSRGVWTLALRGDTLVSAGADLLVCVWDLVTGNWGHILRGHTSTIRDVQIVNEKTVISGSRDKTIRIWNMQSGYCKYVLTGHTATVRCLAAAGDILVSASYDRTAMVWGISEGVHLHTLKGHEESLYSLAFDGERIITGSLDCNIKVWNTAGECLATLQGHPGLVGDLQIREDILASSDNDGGVRIWNLEDMSPIHRITTAAKVLARTPLEFDDNRIVTGGGDGKVKIWDFATGHLSRELVVDAEIVWNVALEETRCIVTCLKRGQLVMEVRGNNA